MKYIPNLRVCNVTELKAGEKFYLPYRDKNYFCIKLRVTGDDRSDEFIMLHPEHPATPGEPAVLLSSVVRSNPIAVIEGASFVVDPSVESLNFGRVVEVPVGSLYITDGDIGIRVWVDQRVSRVYSTKTGR